MQSLNEDEINDKLSLIDKEWELFNLPYLKKDFIFESFKEALNFVNIIAEISESLNHHPNISISYNKVSLEIFTHDINSITDLDFNLAKKIDELSSDDNQELLDTIELLKNGSDYDRRRAATKLGKIGDDQAVGPLLKSLKVDDRSVQKAAIRSLGKIGNKRAIKPLNKFLGHKDAEFRWSARDALIEIGSAAKGDLIDSLESQNYHQRIYAIEALEEIGGNDIGEYIKRALSDEESQVRWRAAKAILNWYDDDSIKRLKTLSKKDSDLKVREESVKSLDYIQKTIKELYKNFENHLKFISNDITIKEVKEGKSYYTLKRQFSGVTFYNPYKIRIVTYQGKKKIKEVKTAKADPRWGTLYLQQEKDLGIVLEAVKQSYIIAKEDFNG